MKLLICGSLLLAQILKMLPSLPSAPLHIKKVNMRASALCVRVREETIAYQWRSRHNNSLGKY
eukprot:1317549-Amphidinium_carterae.1